MREPSSEVSVVGPTNELSRLFGEPALVGQETLEGYNQFHCQISLAIKPTDAIGWILTKDVTDWCWDIRRARSIKAETIKYYQKQIVAELMKSVLGPSGQRELVSYRTFQADRDLVAWVTDRDARAIIDNDLDAKGHSVSSILAQAYLRGAAQIDQIDRRIAFHERQRDAALKQAGLWQEHLLRQLNEATAEVIEGEFTDIAN
jgi:hypothetical protein